MRELAEEFGVCERTIRRDIDDLSGEAGIPIYTQSGKYGGVYIDAEYTMDRMYMTESEIELLYKIKNLVYNSLCEKENTTFDYILKCYKKPQCKAG